MHAAFQIISFFDEIFNTFAAACTRWDGQKNEVITFSRDAKINTAGSTSNGELQAALLIGFAKQKRNL